MYMYVKLQFSYIACEQNVLQNFYYHYSNCPPLQTSHECVSYVVIVNYIGIFTPIFHSVAIATSTVLHSVTSTVITEAISSTVNVYPVEPTSTVNDVLSSSIVTPTKTLEPTMEPTREPTTNPTTEPTRQTTETTRPGK